MGGCSAYQNGGKKAKKSTKTISLNGKDYKVQTGKQGGLFVRVKDAKEGKFEKRYIGAKAK